LHIVIYADNFAITANNKDVLEQVEIIISKFLKERGLELSREKTSIAHINDGFDFLGLNFRKYNKKLIIKPSIKSINKVTKKISEVIHDSRTARQEFLILKLNQVLDGWCNYHQPACSKKTFEKLNYRLFIMICKWAKRKHPNKGTNWIKYRYWTSKGSRSWIFTDGKVTLIRPSDKPIVRHERLKLDMNPYKYKTYFLIKQENRRNAKKVAYKRTAAFKSKLTKNLIVKNA